MERQGSDALITLRNVCVDYHQVNGALVRALDGFTLAINRGEFLSVVGESGSGKSTLLRTLAGLESCSSGQVLYSAGRPKIAMVFQENSLFPWMTVEGNLTYSLTVRRVGRDHRRAIAVSACEQVGLDPLVYSQKYPRELSGGERRRVAVGMALVYEADLLLLDEPSSGLDDLNKSRFQRLLQDLWRRKPFTVVIVTHDMEEAVFLGDRVACLQSGRLVDTVPVPFSRPRKDELRFSDSFGCVRRKAFELCGTTADC